MTEPQNKKTVEDQLADYTDRILTDKSVKQDEATFAPDPELRALEQTALHLQETFGSNDLEEEVIQRIQRNVVKQWQQQREKAQQSIWQKWINVFKVPEQKWQSQRSRQRFSMALSFAILAVLLLVTVPLLSDPTPSQPGASGQNPSALILVVFGALFLLAVWIFRRKP